MHQVWTQLDDQIDHPDFSFSFCRPVYFGNVIEEESEIPESTIDEFEQLLAVLRGLNRW